MNFNSRYSRRSVATASLFAAASVRAAAAQSTPEASPESGTRTITDVYGEVEVPANPQRVVVLDGPMLDALLSVGVKPVGATTGFENEPWPAYLGDVTEGIENVGIITEPNIEKIIAANPDLIISSKVRHDAIHDTLMEIAPTVFSETVGATWRDDYLLYTNAVNKEAEAAEIVAAFDARAEEFKAATADSRADWEISVIRFLPDAVRIYRDTGYIGVILNALDLPRPEAQIAKEGKEFSETISAEQIQLANGTHLFACAWGELEASPAAEFVDSGLWGSLDAVQNDAVYWVDDDYWMVGIGYIAANMVVDELFTYLVDGEPGVAIPV